MTEGAIYILVLVGFNLLSTVVGYFSLMMRFEHRVTKLEAALLYKMERCFTPGKRKKSHERH